ncbi:hypothetical protein H4Q26_002577 [Puccinia striiformis f. sp. tritici PST-130]|nr:hypothetical protein H4Q26_002577 [Puccinia striiformis f. sp. tritici PST-130]
MPRLSQRVGNGGMTIGSVGHDQRLSDVSLTFTHFNAAKSARGLERIRATINNHHRSNKNSYYLNLIRQSSRRCSKGLPYHRKVELRSTAEDMVDLTERDENKLTSNQECQQQADLVIEGFKNLFEKCRAEQIYQHAQQHRSTRPEGRLVKQTDPDNDLLVGLSSALPQLKQQIDAIVELCEPANLLKDQHSKFKLILGIQSDFNRTMDQIFSATRILRSAKAKIPSRINDQHLQALKRYRFNRLHFRLTYSQTCPNPYLPKPITPLDPWQFAFTDLVTAKKRGLTHGPAIRRNLAYFSNKQSSPSQLKPVELLDQIELDLIENSYNQMQKEMLQKKEKILDKIKKNLPRTDEEEEWLDNEGNPIDEKLFIDALLGMKDNDPIQATESHIKALHKIMKYSDNIVQLTIKTSAKSKNKKNTAATEPPALKKKKPNKPETNTRIATLCQKVEVLNWHHANGKNQTKTATHFDKLYPELKLTQPRISAWLKDEISIRQNELETSASVKRVNKTKFETVDKLLEEWTRNAIVAKLVISGDLLCEKWKDFARLQGIPSTQWLKLSNGWLDSFKARNNLK